MIHLKPGDQIFLGDNPTPHMINKVVVEEGEAVVHFPAWNDSKGREVSPPSFIRLPLNENVEVPA